MTFSHERWRVQYEADMRRAEDTYQDVLDALHEREIPASMEQTGGMCLAIAWGTSDGGHYLLTDYEGPLPWNREHLTGWAFGRYDAESNPVGDIHLAESPAVQAAVTLILNVVLGQAPSS